MGDCCKCNFWECQGRLLIHLDDTAFASREIVAFTTPDHNLKSRICVRSGLASETPAVQTNDMGSKLVLKPQQLVGANQPIRF